MRQTAKVRPVSATNSRDNVRPLAPATIHHLGEVRGAGLLLALKLPEANGDARVVQARDKGLIINAARPDTLRFMPALIVSREEIEMCGAILDEVLLK